MLLRKYLHNKEFGNNAKVSIVNPYFKWEGLGVACYLWNKFVENHKTLCANSDGTPIELSKSPSGFLYIRKYGRGR